jgi:hypothetical protein
VPDEIRFVKPEDPSMVGAAEAAAQAALEVSHTLRLMMRLVRSQVAKRPAWPGRPVQTALIYENKKAF